MQKCNGGIHTIFHEEAITIVYDRYLMNIFYDWNLSKKELVHLNACRLYLRVTLVSDITTYDGSSVEPDILQCVRTRRSILTWPRQLCPSKAARNC